MPQSEDEWLKVSEGFRKSWNFPHALGAVDGKHIAIKKPPGSGSFFFNYKKFFSIVLMAVVDPNYEFIVADVGVNGRVSDGGVISHTDFGRMMDNQQLAIPPPEKLCDDDVMPMPYVFVGDEAFSLTANFMKPYPGRGAEEDDIYNEKCIFNYRLSRARMVVENAFGILASRFGVFQRQMLLSPEKAQTVTLACCYLHNFLRRKSKRYIMQGTVDWEDENGTVHGGSWRDSQIETHGLQATQRKNASDKAKDIRDMFRRYFCTKGSVPWQRQSYHFV